MTRRPALFAAIAAALVSFVASGPGPARAQAQPQPAAAPEVVVLQGATVHTEPGKVIEDASVLIRGGAIRGVGKNLAVPRGARVIDAQGKVVTAGIIAASTGLGLVEVSIEGSARRGSIGGGPGTRTVNASYDVRDSYNPRSVAIPVVRAQGVTAAVVAPDGGLIPGTASCFALTTGSTEDALVAETVAMFVPVGSGAQETGWMALTRLREVLDDARAYGRQRAAYNRNQTRPFQASRLDLEALQPVLAGRVPLVVRTDRASDIEAALRLARDYGLRLVIEGGAEAWLVADQLAQAQVPVLLDPIYNLPAGFDALHSRDDNATLLHQAGVTVAIINLGAVHTTGTLRQLAGVAVANGLPWEQALAAITTAPAAIFGISRGRVATGQAADLVVWSGDPFELSTRAEHVFIAGEEQDLTTRQTLLRDRYRRLP